MRRQQEKSRKGAPPAEEGYGQANLDKSSENASAIRGREQELIKINGGAQSQGGTSGNAINGVSSTNPNAQAYGDAAESEFGGSVLGRPPIEPTGPEGTIEPGAVEELFDWLF